jgi:hypothetical protein
MDGSLYTAKGLICIIARIARKLLSLHRYKTTVAYKLYDTGGEVDWILSKTVEQLAAFLIYSLLYRVLKCWCSWR